MKPDRWQRVRTILETALELPPDKRVDYLDKACARDSELRKEVDSLLAYRKPAESFLEGPAVSELGDNPSGSATSDIGEESQLVGRFLSHYKIVAKTGHGGMGEVYQARDETLGRDVAIKVLRQEWASDPDRLRRFEQEAPVVTLHPCRGQAHRQRARWKPMHVCERGWWTLYRAERTPVPPPSGYL